MTNGLGNSGSFLALPTRVAAVARIRPAARIILRIVMRGRPARSILIPVAESIVVTATGATTGATPTSSAAPAYTATAAAAS